MKLVGVICRHETNYEIMVQNSTEFRPVPFGSNPDHDDHPSDALRKSIDSQEDAITITELSVSSPGLHM